MKNWQEREEFLADIELPIKTESYSPVPHGVFVRDLQQKIQEKGYEIAYKRYLTNKNGQVLTGEYGIKTSLDDEMLMSVGFQNSYNKQVKASIQSGVLVLVCKNGMYTTKGVRYSRKHTGDVLQELQDNMVLCVENLEENFLTLQKQREEMKQVRLNKETVSRIIGDMYINETLLTSTQLEIVKKERFFSENFKELTGWSLLNWCTEALKNTSPKEYLRSHLKVSAYLQDRLGITDSPKLYGEPFVKQEEYSL